MTAGNYRIKYSKPGDFFPRTILVPPTSSQYTVEQLQFGTNYTFTVRAEMTLSFCSSSLNGDYVDPIDVTTEISSKRSIDVQYYLSREFVCVLVTSVVEHTTCSIPRVYFTFWYIALAPHRKSSTVVLTPLLSSPHSTSRIYLCHRMHGPCYPS